jgi:tetratricopeptide (TPR) repeat protein
MMVRVPFRVALLSIALALAACNSTPPAPDWVGPEPSQLVAEIRAAGQAASDELDVQPLRDPMVEDLRVQAAEAERRGDIAAAVTALDKALALSPDDPALLQERAEAAVLLKDLARAETFARRAFETGAKVGPLCRRHWATIRAALAHRQRMQQAQIAARPPKGEALAQAERDAAALAGALAAAAQAQTDCTSIGPQRF